MNNEPEVFPLIGIIKNANRYGDIFSIYAFMNIKK